MLNDKGPTRAQLQKQATRLKLQVAALEDRLARYQAGDTVRREGEHWYELIEHFDAQQIQRLPVKSGRAFIMGQLNSMTVVEVSRDMAQNALVDFGQWLESNGIEALIVTEGVRFLKIRTVDAETEAKLDACPVRDDGDTDGKANALTRA